MLPAKCVKKLSQRIVLWVGIPAGDEIGQAGAFEDIRHSVIKTKHTATRGVVGAEGRIPRTNRRDCHQRCFVLFCKWSRHFGAGANCLEFDWFVIVKCRPGDSG